MAWAHDLEAPPRYQSEPTSVSKSQNCGVTVAAAIADFYRDHRHPIEAGRVLIERTGPYRLGITPDGRPIVVTGAPRDTPTNARQQAEILRRWGVTCEVVRFTSARQLHDIVDSGRRPVLLGLNFAHVPDDVAGHRFQGWHAIKVRCGEVVGGVRGFLVNDPNFWPSRPDPARGQRFYPDRLMQAALDAVGGSTGVAPMFAKPDPGFTEDDEVAVLSRIKPDPPRDFEVRAGVVLRKGPGEDYPVHWTVPTQQTFRLVGLDIDPVTREPTDWVAASRPGGTGLFFVPPDHSP